MLDCLYSAFSAHGLVRRLGLEKQVRGSDRRLTIITAGGGWGKTSFLSSLARNRENECIWHDVLPADRDPDVFLLRLCRTAARTLPSLKCLAGPDVPAPPAWRDLVHSIHSATFDVFPRRIILIFDDFHLAGAGKRFGEAVRELVARAPVNVQTIVASREIPQALADVFPPEAVLDIEDDGLRFDAPEISEFLLSNHGMELPSHDLDSLKAKTEGWPIALRLVAQTLAQSRDRMASALPDLTGGSGLDVYFRKELLERQPEEIRDFLLRSSLFESFDVRLCREVLGYDEPEPLMAEVRQRGLFVVAVDEGAGSFRYHHLFQDFLRREMQAGDQAEMLAIHRKAAAYFNGLSVLDVALEHALLGQDYAQAAMIIGKAQAALQSIGTAERLKALLDAIPEEAIKTHLSLHYAKGWMTYLLGDWISAKPILTQVKTQAMAERNPLVVGYAIFGLMILNFTQDDHEENVRLAEESALHLPSESPMRLLNATMQAISLMQLGKLEDSKQLWKDIESSPLINASEYIRMNTITVKGLNYYTFVGEFGSALQVLEQSIEYFNKSNDFLGRQGRFRIFLAFTLYEMGDLDKSYSLSRQAIDTLEAHGQQDALAPAYSLHALTCLHLGLVEEAALYVNKALELKAKANSYTIWKEVIVHATAASVYLVQGRKEAFFAVADKAINLAKKNDLWFNYYIAYSILAPHFAELGMPDKALSLLTRAEQVTRKAGALYDNARCLLMLAALNVDQGRTDMARQQIKDCLAIAVPREYGFLFLRKESEAARKALPLALEPGEHLRFVAVLLVRLHGGSGQPLLPLLGNADASVRCDAVAILAQEGCRDVEKEIAALRRDPDGGVRAATESALERLRTLPPLPLTVKLLGPFSLRVGEREVPASAWKRKVAKTLFKYLLAHAGKEIPTERLLDSFFPDTDADSGRALLHQAMSAIRTVLEPGIAPRRESSYLKVREGIYALLLPEGSRLDARDFERLCVEAADAQHAGRHALAAARYREALDLYGGDYLEDEPYADWARERRHRMLDLRRTAQLAVAAEHMARHEPGPCMSLAREILAGEPWNEQACLLFMRACLATGDRLGAVRAFEDCRRDIEQAHGLKPSQRLLEMYAQIVAN